MKPWNVYIVRCADDSLYTGIAKDLERRVAEHNSDDTLGAKYTRGRRPVELVYSEHFDSRSEAARRESEIKRMKRDVKQNLITAT
jgi:putative endonuclease